MDYNGKTPAELYAEELKDHFDEKKRLQEIIDTYWDRRQALRVICTHDTPTQTLQAMKREIRDAEDRLRSQEFVEKERMLVLLSPLYSEDTE